jgi:hypothetical protein
VVDFFWKLFLTWTEGVWERGGGAVSGSGRVAVVPIDRRDQGGSNGMS